MFESAHSGVINFYDPCLVRMWMENLKSGSYLTSLFQVSNDQKAKNRSNTSNVTTTDTSMLQVNSKRYPHLAICNIARLTLL